LLSIGLRLHPRRFRHGDERGDLDQADDAETAVREMVPLADSTIYEMEKRGEFPRRFTLSPRQVTKNKCLPLPSLIYTSAGRKHLRLANEEDRGVCSERVA